MTPEEARAEVAAILSLLDQISAGLRDGLAETKRLQDRCLRLQNAKEIG